MVVESERFIGTSFIGPGANWMPLAEGVQRTIEHFRAAAGRIDVERAIA
jgi:hypothetical protein